MSATEPIFDAGVQLTGADGNAFAILGACQRAARRAGVPPRGAGGVHG